MKTPLPQPRRPQPRTHHKRTHHERTPGAGAAPQLAQLRSALSRQSAAPVAGSHRGACIARFNRVVHARRACRPPAAGAASCSRSVGRRTTRPVPGAAKPACSSSTALAAGTQRPTVVLASSVANVSVHAVHQQLQQAVATKSGSRRAAARPASCKGGGGDGPQPSRWLSAGELREVGLSSSSAGGGGHVCGLVAAAEHGADSAAAQAAQQDSAACSMGGVLGGGGLGGGGGGGERATAALGSGLVPERVHAQPRQAGPQRAWRGDAATPAARLAPLVRGCCVHQHFRATHRTLQPLPPQ